MCVLLCFIDPRVRKIKNEASSCPWIFSRTLRRVADPRTKSWWGDPPTYFSAGILSPYQIFSKLHLVRGFYPKLVRGERSKTMGTNAEIVWRRALTPDGAALHPWRDCTLVSVSSRTHPKNVPVRPSWPELHRSSPPPSAVAEVRCLEGHVRATGHLLGPPGQPAVTIFCIEGLVCCISARPSRSSTLRHGAPLAEVISTRWSPAARMRAWTRARCFSPYIPAFFCPVHTRESIAAPNLEYDYLTRKTGCMWPLWIAWQRNVETTAGELERHSAPTDLAVRGGCSRADISIYLCLLVFTLVLLHMKWHIRSNSCQLF